MLAGDHEAEKLWRAREARVQEILQEANHAALVHMEERAGFVRPYDGASRQVGNVQTARWERARVVVTTWLQGTNRDGEPHEHSHNVIARSAEPVSEVKWRGPRWRTRRRFVTPSPGPGTVSRPRRCRGRRAGMPWRRSCPSTPPGRRRIGCGRWLGRWGRNLPGCPPMIARPC